MNKDQLLHDYIITHSAELTEKWLKLRRKLRGRFYSEDQLSEEKKQLLIEQHTFTNTTIASALLEDPAVFQQNKEKWAAQVAKSRVEQDAQVHEVVEAIGNSRTVFWEAVTRFMDEHQDIVTSEDARRWNHLVNGSIDQLMTDFTEQYQILMISRLSSQQELISELSCPVILIADTIGTLPLIGAIDTERARVILETVPENCVAKRITNLVIDLSGVPIVDTMVAQQLYMLSKTLFLLGIRTVFSGIRPDVAQTSIQLGLDFSEYQTYGSLEQALASMGVTCIIEETKV
ncbi:MULTISPECIES: STAS domain-containing protein [Bacillus amyloliquefaciens group]|uniref:Sulphate transporter/antisigma-factor n=1 Tax=Bacillus amyloliquefaciens (strain ATCC 23350 / DSM 7 / BCRC 11601 / CCUG 28519 / NBRC 15535 / NRRL B-14393 / F) TaxID=692420 RepID=A0A9P1NGT8_BACAS|nr:STAS domain-containing protein [Bacillus amyloliquefaciens]AIW32724.1 sulfate transporter [Bacillus subtilis]AEB22832.1 Sulphate transporter/antisigma-factor [Bacillus amyloliquefaciens TA208]AEK87828.1 putative paralog of RsbR [Bacillus amyloliquefaciens XH7]ARW37904.1 RsbT co-antagonist protein RsbRB [Bacillus amyloliquefaciens]AZV92151.1 sulfate transporter [Bacillus amyloliquefaciens]